MSIGKISVLAAAGGFLLTSAGELQKLCGPEMWYSWNGGSVGKPGIVRDIEEISAAGVSGIHLLHCERKVDAEWAGVCPQQIRCMDENWMKMVEFLGQECNRKNVKLTFQNCPGWSQSGGPWVPIEHAMRDIAYASAVVKGGERFDIPAIPDEHADKDGDWRDVACLAFPLPEGEVRGELKPAKVEPKDKMGLVRTFRFAQPETVRSVEFPPLSLYNLNYPYHAPWISVSIEARTTNGWESVFEGKLPKSNWQDRNFKLPLTIACNERTSDEWRITMRNSMPIHRNPMPKFFACARQNNWEMKTGRMLRSLMRVPFPAQNEAAWIKSSEIVVLGKGVPQELPAGRDWMVMRFGNVNSRRVNKPAPPSATGWECDKLDPAGIEAHYAGYIGMLKRGVLKSSLSGMLVDSWEVGGQTWTGKMPEYFRKACGYDITLHLPSLFGMVVDSPAATEKFLTDWRRLNGDLITKNYFKRMAELAHADGLRVVYETAFGDIVNGDMLEFWKYSDEPMCEFWSPHDDRQTGHVCCHAFKPVRPCSSAAHVYGRSRVTAEAFTSWGVTWRENPRQLKGEADRHFARGVTHLAINNYLHAPVAENPPPGRYSGANGSPFTYCNPWWHAMRDFTSYFRLCEEKLESGLPANDVLWYLGDAVDHLPDAYADFPEGFAFDYLGHDALMTAIECRDGVFVNQLGTKWRVLWVPDDYLMLPATKARLDAFAAAGGKVVYGGVDALKKSLAGTKPMVVTEPRLGDAPNEDLMWIARNDGGKMRYFVCGGKKGWKGFVTFRAEGLATILNPVTLQRRAWRNGGPIELAADESIFVEFEPQVQFGKWKLTLPPESGAAAAAETDRAESWSSLGQFSREVQAFAGTGVYETEFTLPEAGSWVLDLGKVEAVAEVFVNGKKAGKLWSSPYRVDISAFARQGRNTLKIAVSNTQRNKIIYELSLPQEKRTLVMKPIPGYWPKADDPFDPSGIAGPVKIERQ